MISNYNRKCFDQAPEFQSGEWSEQSSEPGYLLKTAFYIDLLLILKVTLKPK